MSSVDYLIYYSKRKRILPAKDIELIGLVVSDSKPLTFCDVATLQETVGRQRLNGFYFKYAHVKGRVVVLSSFDSLYIWHEKMHNSKEPVSLRNGRLFNSVLTRSGPMQRITRMKMSQDALLDAFILLYDECNKENFKKDSSVNYFINKYRTLVFEIKSLRVNLDDFDLKNVIGRGHFGEVRVVKEKHTNDIYAMKIIKKFETPSKTCPLFEEEHDIMCTATSQWLTTLQYSFQDNENLYFIMEYHSGGDLLSLLDRHGGILTPEMARFYLAETALAIKALHQMGYVHRDIKPDNILLDRCGHVKLADFGSSAKLSASGLVAQTMPVGTPEYVAPEILSSLEYGCFDKPKNQCYGVECDYWSLGILAYELVVGRTPFSGNQLKSTYFNIMNHKKKLKYPEDKAIPDSLQDLISKLLEDPSARLKHYGVMKHPFFSDINWANIRNEAPPFVPTSKSDDDVSNFIEVPRKKSTPRIDVKDGRKDFSGKHLPFIGFTYSRATDPEKAINLESGENNAEKKNPVLEASLAVTKRENKNLVSKLFEAQFGKNEEVENLEKKLEEKKKLLEICEKERNALQRELAKSQTENTNMQRILELERQDRKEMEANALKLISENKTKIERNVNNQIKQLNAKIEELNDKLTEAHTINNELTSKKDRMKAELAAANDEIEILKKLEADFKNKMTEAREFKRKSVVGLESRLKKMESENQSQANILQQKLNEEAAAKCELEKKLEELGTTWLTKESQYKEDGKEYEEKIASLETKVNAQHLEIASLLVQLSEKPNVDLLEERLELEKSECSKLRARITAMEQELTNSTHSFMDHESAIAAHEETMQALEKELREASDEKIRLQKKLQKTRETEEENRQKLSNLEVVVDRLEQGVLKLETENAKLKQQVIAHAQPITSEAETRYQEKITILEDQIAKLENQVQKLRESSVLDKEALKTTQSALWKAEKELSDTKIDVRIAKREAKTAEDLTNKLQEELRKLNETLGETERTNQMNLATEREKLDKHCLEKASLKSELSQKELEIKVLKGQVEEMEEMKKMEKQLKKDYNELCQKCKLLEKQADVLKEEKEKMKECCQALEVEKLKMESAADELKHKICSLELNNQVLKETGAMLDEQLEDYDKFTTTQTQKIEGLAQEKKALEKEIENIQNELRTSRKNLNEEKSLKLRAEQRVAFLESEVACKDDSLSKLEKELVNCNSVIEKMKTNLTEYEESIAALEVELTQRKQNYDALNDECRWLKKEASSYLTSLYSLRESNYKLTQDLEEEHQMVEVLQERINELQNAITELESFHKQREIKDEATKQQQSKLITFLQEKLDDTKKKKTITDVIFGSRNKENVVPVTSPTSKTETLKRSKNSSKNLLNSPTTKEALSQLVKSPSSQSYFQRQASMQRMHHNIPHRFKSQLVIRSGVCGGCHSPINRGAQCSSCSHCGVQAHPKCAFTVPKTCGLPQGLVKHYAQSVAKSDATEENAENPDGAAAVEGWIKTLNSNKTSWEKKFARLDGNKLLIFENRPVDKLAPPVSTLNLCPDDGHVMIADGVEPNELPNIPKANIPYIMKIVKIAETTRWPQEVHYLMVPSSSDKPKWLAALNGVVLNSSVAENVERYRGTLVRAFPKGSVDPNCVARINDKIVLLGGEEGLFSLKADAPEPVKIEGVDRVLQVALAPQIGVAVMVVDRARRLVTCDHRALVSNAEAAACANPSIAVRDVHSGVEDEGCLMFEVSPSVEGCAYLTVATSTKLSLSKWCVKSSEFHKMRVLETLHPCNCVLYTKRSVIVGCDKFFEIGLKDFSAQEFLDPSVKSLAFWRIGSFPMRIFQIAKTEYLLCFNEFGVFVDEKGRKTQCDLKWSKVPCDFAYSKPYLYVMHASSVEVMRVPFLDSKSSEDSICTSSTSTVSDSVHLSLNGPRYLGEAKAPGAIYVRTTSAAGVDLVLLEGKKLCKDDVGSCASLNTILDEPSREKIEGDEFSFTSSLVHSLEEVGSSTPRHSDEESCTTYTVSDGGNNPKRVTFVQQTVM